MTKDEIMQEIERIKHDWQVGVDLSYAELAFLQENQEIIKQEYCDDIDLWQLADIPESDWNARGQDNSNRKMKYINWSTDIFAGFYESELYNNDMLYNFTENDDELKADEYYDFVDGGYSQYELAIAQGCTDLLFKNLHQDKMIIKNMRFVKLHSPKYYNFETDKIELEITCDWHELLLYITQNESDFNKYLQETFTSYDGFISFVPNNANDFMDNLQDDFERLSQVIIEYYILRNLDTESYLDDCVELAHETIWQYIAITKDESQTSNN